MLSFDHPNVMTLIGVCVDGEMPLLIMPFMSNGSALVYVRQNKKELTVSQLQDIFNYYNYSTDEHSYNDSAWNKSSNLQRNAVSFTT